jgi:hypothetical protein
LQLFFYVFGARKEEEAEKLSLRFDDRSLFC